MNEEFTIRYNWNTNLVQIRNIKLMDIEDPEYLDFRKSMILKSKKLREERNNETDDSLKSYIYLSLMVEKSLIHWLKSSTKRILYWEELVYDFKSGRKKWNRMYNEMDFVLMEDDNNIIIGEIKTKINVRSSNKGNSQLEKRKNVLDCIPNLNVKTCLISVLMEQKPETIEKHPNQTKVYEFKPNFSDVEKYEYSIKGNESFTITKTHFDIKDVVKYGLENGLINNERILDLANEEIIKKRNIESNKQNQEITQDDVLKLSEKFTIKK